MKHQVLIFPDDTPQRILDALASASRSIRIKMFIFTAPVLLDAVIAAHQRGVDVRVMLNPERRSGKQENTDSRQLLESAGIKVQDSNPSFDLTHEKSLVIDDELAIVHSLNWEDKNLFATRDYAVITHNAAEVAEIAECFDADWNHGEFTPHEDSSLLWCRGNARERFAHLIDSAEESLWVQNERYQDSVIIERLVRAAVRGVKVHILARPPHTLKMEKLIEGVGGLRIMQDVGCKVHRLDTLRLHGKLMIADQSQAIIGSINLAPGSFDSRRELAIEVKGKEAVHRLHQVAHQDWKDSSSIDLSDEGLIHELKKHEMAEGVHSLVLDEHHRRERD